MLSESEKNELLEHEKLVGEILKIRSPADPAESWWNSPHVTTAVAAVLTVAVTTIATIYSQTKLKASEYALARQDVRLNQTRETMIGVYDLLANLLKGTEDRAKMAAGLYDMLPDSMLAGIVNETNAIDARWRRERETVEAAVYLYFGDSQTTVAQWRTTRAAMQGYADCAEQIYVRYLATRAPADACAKEQRAAESAFAGLRDALIKAYLGRLAA